MAIAPVRSNRRLETPHRKRWTVKEADRLAEAGFLAGRYEVIEGEIYEKMSTNPPHILTLILLTGWLHRVFGSLFVRTQTAISLPGRHNRPEPDATVTREPATAYADRLPGPEALLLAVEVSDTTLRFDLTTKAALYARTGIPEYWVLDIQARRLIVHRRPGRAGYADIQEYAEDAQIAPEARPDALVLVSFLFPPQEVSLGSVA